MYRAEEAFRFLAVWATEEAARLIQVQWRSGRQALETKGGNFGHACTNDAEESYTQAGSPLRCSPLSALLGCFAARLTWHHQGIGRLVAQCPVRKRLILNGL